MNIAFFQKWHSLYFFIILLACNASSSDTPVVSLDEASTKTIIDNLSASANAKTDTSLKVTAEVIQEEVDTQYINTVKKRIATSEVAKTYKNDCAAILKKYQTIAKKYVTTGEEKTLDEILDWSNDPIFLSCKKQKAYSIAFEEVDKLLE